MMNKMLLAKIRFATITESNMRYEGSIGIDRQICEDLGIDEYQVINVNSLDGSLRTETYVLYEDKPGAVIARGALAALLYKGDDVHLNLYGYMSKEASKEYQPIIIESNKPYMNK